MTTAPFDELDDRPPRHGRRMVLKASAAAIVIVLAVGAAVASIGLLQLSKLTDIIKIEQAKNGGSVVIDELPPVEAGKPQTIMILGTDERKGADKSELADARSDTIILARLNADRSAISLLSIPRDLKVDFPGSVPDKINSAFTRGGANLTAKTVKNLLSRPGAPFRINHVVQVSFSGFRELVDFLGCSWVDVDRHYFNDRGGPTGYATIDIDEGYQKLCGTDALSYVRYRHTDNDLVRGARQQDFVRQLLRQPGVRRRLNFDQREKLARIAGRFTRTDKSLETNKGIITLLKLGLGVANKPVVQVPFGDGRIEDDGSFLTASDDAIAATVKRFMNPKVETGRAESTTKRKRPAGSGTKKRSGKKRKAAADAWKDTAGMRNVASTGETYAIAQQRKLGFPFYYPTLIPSIGTFVGNDGPRRYSLRAGRKVYRAYRTVIDVGGTNGFGQFLGVQGMEWKNPPLLQGPHDTITVDRRKLEVFWDGRKVRLVAWRTRNGVYWVSNTLTRTQPYSRMVATARSLTHLR